jgi:dihydrodipicolinate synthase/N-acetylneuraminate lyase
MFTPIDEEGVIDLKGLQVYAEYLAANEAVSALFFRSGVGGIFTFREEEIGPAVEVVAEVAKDHQKPFLIGCAGTWPGWPEQPLSPDLFIEESIRFGLEAMEQGAFAAVYPFPYGLLDPEKGGADSHDVYLYYFDQVASQMPGRMVLYHLPYLEPRQWVAPETLSQILERHENIVGMKVSHGDVVHHSELLMVTEDTNFAYICGNEQIYLPLLLLGACGVIGEGCNSIPEVFDAISRDFMAREFEDAREAQFVAIEAIRLGQAVCRGFSEHSLAEPALVEQMEVFTPDSIGLGYLAQKGIHAFGPNLRSGGIWPSKKALHELVREFDQLRAAFLS